MHANGTVLFVLSALALIPLAYLIGEATENVAEHTGSRIGGFLNASFGNAPELIISLFAISDALPAVVLGSITGSVVSCALLVLGAAIAYGGGEGVDRRSLLLQIGVLAAAVALFLIPSVPSWNGDPSVHSLYLISLPVAGVLLLLYLGTTVHNLRGHSTAAARQPLPGEPWSLRAGIATLVVATLATAAMSHVLVHSLEAFVENLGLSQFFVAAVIVALVGNATEHGGAIVTARRGNSGLGSEIAISSATQVAVLVDARRRASLGPRREGAAAGVPPGRDRDDGLSPRSRFRRDPRLARPALGGVRPPRRLCRVRRRLLGRRRRLRSSRASAPGCG